MKNFALFALATLLMAQIPVSAQEISSNPQPVSTRFAGWATNAPAVYKLFSQAVTNPAHQLRFTTNLVFDHFIPGTLSCEAWTNFMAHTNGASIGLWSVRLRPAGWPAMPPVVRWNTHCIAWGMAGLTAISPCWEGEGGPGQVPITALTKRHGYTRGHGMGPEGFRKVYAGKKVWFLAADDTLIERRIVESVTRITQGRDYTIMLFNQDLPDSIAPMRVVSTDTACIKSPYRPNAPWLIFRTEQGGCISTTIPGFSTVTWKGGDSGSPDMLPLPGELVFFRGRTTTGPSPKMQKDMDALCKSARLNPSRYQLDWADLSMYPSFASGF